MTKFLFFQSLHLYTYNHVMYFIKNNYFHTMHDIFLFTYHLSNGNGISVKKKKRQHSRVDTRVLLILSLSVV